MYLLVMNNFWISIIMIETFIQKEYPAGVFEVLQNFRHEN